MTTDNVYINTTTRVQDFSESRYEVLVHNITEKMLTPTEFMVYDTDAGDPFCTDYLTYDVGWFSKNNPTKECVNSLARSNCFYLWHNHDDYEISWFENVHTLVCVGIRYSKSQITSRKNSHWSRWYSLTRAEPTSILQYGMIFKNGEYHLMSPMALEFGLVYDLSRNDFYGYATNITHALVLEHRNLIIGSSPTLPAEFKHITYTTLGKKTVFCNDRIVGNPIDDNESDEVIATDFNCDPHQVLGVIQRPNGDLLPVYWCLQWNCVNTKSFGDLFTTELNRKFEDDEHENFAVRILLIIRSLIVKATLYITQSINLRVFSLSVWGIFTTIMVIRLTGSWIAGTIMGLYVVVLLSD